MRIIDEELFNELLVLLSKRNKTLFKKLEVSKEYENSIVKARRLKSEKIVSRIRESLYRLSQELERQPTKYEVHNDTGIAYITLKKYYDKLVEEY